LLSLLGKGLNLDHFVMKGLRVLLLVKLLLTKLCFKQLVLVQHLLVGIHELVCRLVVRVHDSLELIHHLFIQSFHFARLVYLGIWVFS
jgi:hypothetical protein